MQLRPDYPLPAGPVVLRPLEPRDLADLLSYRGDAETCRYLPFEPMDEPAVRHRLLADFSRTELSDEGQALTLGAELDGRIVGDLVLFWRSRVHRSGELGYVFAPAVRGQGLAPAAARAMLGLGFDGLGLHRITARIDARNTASARLAQRLGMRQEAHLVQNEWFKGEWSDELDFAILAEEWAARG